MRMQTLGMRTLGEYSGLGSLAADSFNTNGAMFKVDSGAGRLTQCVGLG